MSTTRFHNPRASHLRRIQASTTGMVPPRLRRRMTDSENVAQLGEEQILVLLLGSLGLGPPIDECDYIV